MVTTDSEIVLDLSRLLSRVHHPTPTGVDRVELAYAESLLASMPDRLAFGALHPAGCYGRIPTDVASAFIAETRAAWSGETTTLGRGARRWLASASVLARMRPHRVPRRIHGRPRVYLQSSPHHLHDERAVRAVLSREDARLVCLIHDLIPIEYPEYARPGGRAAHLRRIRTVARLASGIISNSHATLRSFAPYLEAEGRTVPCAVAHLGVDDLPTGHIATPAAPYFVCLGTIEARKNHLLLLNLWRRLVERSDGGAVPKLIIIGRRGWENEQVIDMLERCPALVDTVEEHRGLQDRQVRSLVAGARALLLPSFAEGFGMPVAEALALGTPVICSDIAALREAGGDAPDYLDALDGIGWHEAIMSYSEPTAQRRAAQVRRIAAWRAPTWRDHIAVVSEVIESLG